MTPLSYKRRRGKRTRSSYSVSNNGLHAGYGGSQNKRGVIHSKKRRQKKVEVNELEELP